MVTKLDRLARSLPDARKEAHLIVLHRTGEHSTAELADPFGVARSTVYRAIDRDERRRSDRSQGASV